VGDSSRTMPFPATFPNINLVNTIAAHFSSGGPIGWQSAIFCCFRFSVSSARTAIIISASSRACCCNTSTYAAQNMMRESYGVLA
jgi:hypothetical protein